MKKIYCFLSIIFSLLFVCVATNNVKAFDKWYEVAAEEADNPVLLEDKEYFQGVSINSHLISDLTFLKIPFEKYLNQEVNQIEIITFTEALYTMYDEVQNDVVLYLYSPDDLFKEIDSLETRIELVSKKILENDEMVDFTLGQVLYHYSWKKVSKYGSIYKFSFSSGISGGYNNDSISEILLDDYNKKQSQIIVSTILNARIYKINYVDKSSFTYQELQNVYYLPRNQQFNFIYEKNVDHPEAVALLSDEVDTAKTHYTTSIGYTETSAKVEGVLSRIRYDHQDITGANLEKYLPFIPYIDPLEHPYIDYFYYFFNVTDTETGEKWTGNEVITEIKYTYYEYLQEAQVESSFGLFAGYTYDETVSITYLYPNGEVYASDITKFEGLDNSEVVIGGAVFDNVSYREPKSMKAIYQTKTISQGTFTNKYPVEVDSPSIEDFLSGKLVVNYIATLPYVFQTSDKEFVQTVDANIYENIKLSDYQFGMLVGDTGYVAQVDESITVFGGYREYQSCVELVSVDEIWYEYEGVKYHATVSETIVDKSHVNTPIIQGPQDFFPSEPDPDLSWWEKLLQWFIDAWEWLKDNYKVIIFVACIVLVIIITIKIIRRIQMYRTQKAIINLANKQKKRE